MQGISRIALMAALAATGYGLVATHAGAQQTDSSTDYGEILGTVSLTASTEAVELGRTGATVNVVTEDDIRKAGDISAAALMTRLPGVSMTRNGGLGTSTALRLRGLSGPYIGVRIDGIDVADPSGTQCAYDFGTTTMGGISRIEVLRGSQSALYGSEAIGGVVDITTWRPTEQGTQAEVAIEGGSDSTFSGTVSAGLLTDRAELAFTLSRTVTDGISAYAFGTEDDAFRATNLSFSAAYDLTETMRIGLNGFWRDTFSEFDSQNADSPETEEGRLRGARIYSEFTIGTVQNELSYARTETRRFYPLGFTQLFEGERDQVAYKGRWEAGGPVSLNWGLDWTEETFASDTDTGSSHTTSVLGEMLYAPSDALDLSLALRRDDHQTFGGKTTGRVALAWRPGADWIIRAVASTGFRAPSLYELHSVYGNSGLTPETSRSFELGAEYLLPNGGSVQATLFDTRIKDKIGFDGASTACASSWGCYVQIPGTTRTRGIELTGRYEITPGWQVFGNYTYTDSASTDAGVTTRLARVPRHDLALGVEGQITDRLTGIVAIQHVADFVDDYFDNSTFSTVRTKLPDYTLVNLSLGYAINDTTQAYLRVENLFNRNYQTVYNYGQPGRQVFLGVRASF